MKRIFLFTAAVLFSLGCFSATAFASITPTLSLAATGSGDNVQMTVTGDPSSSVLLSYTETGVGPIITSLGSTNTSGSFTTDISSVGYNIVSGTPVTVLVGGTSGARSPVVAWPTVTSTNSLSLSQSAVVVNVGSSSVLTVTNNPGALYLSSNSNPSIANVSISGTQVTISGNSAGATTVTLCAVGSSSSCPSVSVTVLASGTGQLSFSQSTVTVVSGQSLPITVSGGSGSYSLVSNSDTGTIQASLNGSVLTLTTGVSSGSASITICSTDKTTCGVVTATAGSTSSVAISFSNTSPSVATNGSTNVNIYGPTGVSFYVSSNSSPSSVQANLTGTTLSLSGITAGTSNVTVCASTGTCNSLTVTVTSVAASWPVALSQNALSLQSGQSAILTVSGGTPPYTISGGTSSVSQQTLSGSSLTVFGVATGTSSSLICSSGGGCVTLTVSINGAVASIATPTVPSTTQTTPVITGSSSGMSQSQVQAILSLLQSFGAEQTVIANVQSSLGGGTTVVSTPTTSTTSVYTFTSFLRLTSQGTEVTELQKHLTALGIYSGPITGYYGPLTQAAVKKFQAANGITQAGYVGPGTRAALNK